MTFSNCYHRTVIHDILFIECLFANVEDEPLILEVTFFSDEAWLHIRDYVNSQNTRAWSVGNLHEMHEAYLYSLEMAVWFAVSPVRTVSALPSEKKNITRSCALT